MSFVRNYHNYDNDNNDIGRRKRIETLMQQMSTEHRLHDSGKQSNMNTNVLLNQLYL